MVVSPFFPTFEKTETMKKEKSFKKIVKELDKMNVNLIGRIDNVRFIDEDTTTFECVREWYDEKQNHQAEDIKLIFQNQELGQAATYFLIETCPEIFSKKFLNDWKKWKESV